MIKSLARVGRDGLSGVLSLALLGVIVATPAHAMKEPPAEPGTGGSSGGTAVPEPSSLALFGAGAAAFMMTRRRAARKG